MTLDLAYSDNHAKETGKKMILSLRFSWTHVGAPDISKKEILYQPFTHISG
jgi:hypothetical protein